MTSFRVKQLEKKEDWTAEDALEYTLNEVKQGRIDNILICCMKRENGDLRITYRGSTMNYLEQLGLLDHISRRVYDDCNED